MGESQDELYQQANAEYGAALDRLVRAYERDTDRQRDLLQEIHLALWRSFEKFEGRCSLRTWVYRIAHNIATSKVIRRRSADPRVFLSLDEIASLSDQRDRHAMHDRLDAERLLEFIHRLKPPDRELMLLYLEDLDAAAIGEITGLSATNVRSKIHRIKAVLARRFHPREQQ